jgi:putative ABC transport system ATP-binding protein
MMSISPETPFVAEAEHLTRIINGQTIVDDVSFVVPRGEIVLVTGESGSGKSTLMRMIEGIDTPTSGQAHLLGRNVTTMPRAERTRLIADNVAVGFQSPNLDTNLTVWQNLIGLTEARGQRPDMRIAARILMQLGLRGRLDEQAKHLSGGEKLKLALGRITVSQPELLMLDEPTYALDHENKELMFQDIARACELGDTSALIVTHDLGPAREIANREFVMANGRLVDEIIYSPLKPTPQPTSDTHLPLGA